MAKVQELKRQRDQEKHDKMVELTKRQAKLKLKIFNEKNKRAEAILKKAKQTFWASNIIAFFSILKFKGILIEKQNEERRLKILNKMAKKIQLQYKNSKEFGIKTNQESDQLRVIQ